jgi:hypothetical protein
MCLAQELHPSEDDEAITEDDEDEFDEDETTTVRAKWSLDSCATIDDIVELRDFRVKVLVLFFERVCGNGKQLWMGVP